VFLPRRRSVFLVLTASVVGFGAPAVGAAGPAPFPMPLDSGTRYVAQASEARADLANAQPEIARTQQRQRVLQARHDELAAQVVSLEAQEQGARAAVEQARVRIAGVAAKQYVEAGGTRLNAAFDAAMDAGDMLDFGRNLHILETSGDHELDLFAIYEAAHAQLVQQVTEVTRQRDAAQDEVDAAAERVAELQASRSTARRRLAEAVDGIARFHRSATTAASPIMGPNLLSAGDMAAFVRAHGGAPRVSVSIDTLAQIYLEEGSKVGVRGDVAFAQSILETGWFEFENSMVEPEDNNFAGVGACDTCKRGFDFPDPRTGVRAQLQLLRVYVDREVGADSLADPLLLPGTLRLGFRGRVQTWWDLTGTWATASNYGNAVYGVYNRMVAASGRR
jgi:Mannosyl-glycoprotein endo-beta-N-acetylglucosaminidase